MLPGDSNKGGQRQFSLYYAVVNRVTDVRGKLHEQRGTLGFRRLKTTLRVNAKLLKGAAAPALIKNRQVIRAGYCC